MRTYTDLFEQMFLIDFVIQKHTTGAVEYTDRIFAEG